MTTQTIHTKCGQILGHGITTTAGQTYHCLACGTRYVYAEDTTQTVPVDTMAAPRRSR